MAFGFGTQEYTVEDFTARASEPVNMMAVHLRDGVYVLTAEAYNAAVADSTDAKTFEAAVRRLHIGRKDEWHRAQDTSDHPGEAPA